MRNSHTYPSRRQFIGATSSAAAMLGAPPFALPATAQSRPPAEPPIQWKAHWIWFPERRMLPCTFVFFRKEFDIARVEGQAKGWVTGNSRYMLYVNGKLLQRGPAPCDPRYWDADPVDLTSHLRPGKNVIGGLVCSFGGGDGTYVPGTPVGLPACAGFMFQAEIPTGSGSLELLTDESWQTHRARCWPAGNYQRWYLKALQEEFDARRYPYGWNEAGFDAKRWRSATVLETPPGRPVLREVSAGRLQPDWEIAPRSIPLILEQPVRPRKLCSAGWIDWDIEPEEYFECFPPDAFREQSSDSAIISRASDSLFPVRMAPSGERSVIATFDFEGEVCGHPYVKLRAPAGTIIEMLFLESQEPGKLLLRTNPSFGQWIRVIARDGETTYEAFDWDVLRYLQLAVRNASGPVEILECGVTQRLYPYPQHPDISTSDVAINRTVRGAITTHLITSQDTIMDNVARERQQYAGDVDHPKLVSYYAFGEYRQPRRMIETYAHGQNEEGWFMDCWPAWDRCARVWQKSLKLTNWGPILDHGLGFVISTATYYLFSGDKSIIEKLYPHFLRFDRFLWAHRGPDGLLPVSDWIRNSVWIDHRGFRADRDKQASFNIYYIGFLLEGIARMAGWVGDNAQASSARRRAAEMTEIVRKHFWSREHGLFVDNLPRIRSDREIRLHDRTLSMALLYDLFPAGQERTAVDILANLSTDSNGPYFEVEKPRSTVGFSFPANGGWRHWALSRYGRADAIVRDLRERWASMISLKENGTFSEDWEPKRNNVWCQNGPVILYVLYGDILGVRPTAPGFRQFDVRPQPGGLEMVSGTIHSPAGPIPVRLAKDGQRTRVSFVAPGGTEPALVAASGTAIQNLPSGIKPETGPVQGTERWKLPSSASPRSWEFIL